MLRLSALCLVLWLATPVLHAQTWCVPTTVKPYSQRMPGITQVRLGDVQRTLGVEALPDTNYVLATERIVLRPGSRYTISIGHSRVTVSFPNVRDNIRGWADLNGNGSFLDAGESLVTRHSVAAGLAEFSFAIPADAPPIANTRLRVSAKLSMEEATRSPRPATNHTIASGITAKLRTTRSRFSYGAAAP